MAFASAGMVLVYLGLAVAGWGGVDAFFANPPRIAVVVVTVAMAVAALFSSGNLSAGEREDRSNRWIIGALGVIGLLSAWLPAYTDRKDFWTIDGDAVRWIGVILYAGGGALRLWPVFVLGRCFSGLVAIQPGHTLVTDGIYRTVRNPSYLGLLALSLGWRWRFVRSPACCSWCSCFRRCWLACARRRPCCARSSAPSTTTTVRGRGGSCRASTDE